MYVDECKSSINSRPRLPFLKPKPSTGSAFCSVTPTADSSKRATTPCALQDVQCRSKQTLSASISTQMLIESCTSKQCQIAAAPGRNDDDDDLITSEVPHEIRSLLPPNNNVRAVSPTHLVVFPPEIPPEYRIRCGSRSNTCTPQPRRETEPAQRIDFSSAFCVQQVESRSTVECLEIAEQKSDEDLQTSRAYGDDNQQQQQQIIVGEPVKPVVKQPPAVVTREENRSESPMVAALITAPEKCYSPLPTFVDASEFVVAKPPDEEQRPTMTMSEALSIAPDRSYKLPESNVRSTRRVGNDPVRYVHGYNRKTPVAPLLLTRTLIYSPASAVDSEEEQIAILGLKSFPPVSDELKLSTAAGDFDRTDAAAGFAYSEEQQVEFSVSSVPETPPDDGTAVTSNDAVAPKSSAPAPPRRPFTASGLHEPLDIPRYQQSIPENPHRASPVGHGKGPGTRDGPTAPKTSTEHVVSSVEPQQSHGNVKVVPASESPLDRGGPSCKTEWRRAGVPKSSETDTADVPVEPVVPMPKTSLPAALLSKKLTCLTNKKQQPKCIPSSAPIPVPDIGGQPTGRTGGGASAGLTAPRRGRGVLNPQNLTPGARVPLCGQCNLYIR